MDRGRAKEKNIVAVIENVRKITDEIIIIDSGSDDATGGDKTAEVSSDSDLSQSAEPPAAEAEPVFSAEQEAERTRESYSEWQAAEAEKKESGIKILGGGCAKCNALEAATVDALFPVCRGCFIRLKKHMLSPM